MMTLLEGVDDLRVLCRALTDQKVTRRRQAMANVRNRVRFHLDDVISMLSHLLTITSFICMLVKIRSSNF
jgi:hypothetical protein